MAKKLEYVTVKKFMNPKLRIDEPVFCACNNLRCSGLCSTIHLIKKVIVSSEIGRNRKMAPTGDHCSAAFNKNNNKDKRVRIQPKSDVYENWQDWV